MPSEDEMTVDERRKYLCKMKKRYTQAHQRERGQVLDEMKAVTGLHRKSPITRKGKAHPRGSGPR